MRRKDLTILHIKNALNGRYLKTLRFYICGADLWQEMIMKNLQEPKPSKIHEETPSGLLEN